MVKRSVRGIRNPKAKPYVKRFGLDLNFGEGNIGGKIAGMHVSGSQTNPNPTVCCVSCAADFISAERTMA